MESAWGALAGHRVGYRCPRRSAPMLVGQTVGVERRAVVTAARAAIIDQQIPTAVAADVPHGHRPEGLDYASGGHAARISTGPYGQKAVKPKLIVKGLNLLDALD